MDDSTREEIKMITAELRHVYAQLRGGLVVRQESMARGKVGPLIVRLETLTGAEG